VTNALLISRFPVPDLANMPEDIRKRILAAQEKSGFIPNVFLALAYRPDEFRAFFAYHDALMGKPGNLTNLHFSQPLADRGGNGAMRGKRVVCRC
jgi:hypothetical protein